MANCQFAYRDRRQIMLAGWRALDTWARGNDLFFLGGGGGSDLSDIPAGEKPAAVVSRLANVKNLIGQRD